DHRDDRPGRERAHDSERKQLKEEIADTASITSGADALICLHASPTRASHRYKMRAEPGRRRVCGEPCEGAEAAPGMGKGGFPWLRFAGPCQSRNVARAG